MNIFSIMTSAARVLAVAVVLLASGAVRAEETPPSRDGAKTKGAAEVQGLVGKASILDVRKKASYLEGHLPTGQSISHAQDKATKKFDAAVFGADKAKPIVIHGHGSDGWSAVAAVKSAVEAGYTNVLWFRGGIREWTEKGNKLAN